MKFTYPSLFDPRQTIEVWFCDAPCCSGKELHRVDGPAVIYPDGTKEWWLHGKTVTEAEVWAHNGELVARAFRAGRSGPVVGPERATIRLKAAQEPKGPDEKGRSEK